MDIKRGIKAIQISQSDLRGGNEAVKRRPETIAGRYLLADIWFIFILIYAAMMALKFF
jgi:hypothetical protein